MIKSKRLAYGILVTLLGTGAAAYAEPPEPGKMPPHVEKVFKDGDTNRDKKLSKEEFTAFHEKVFQDADADHDGILSFDEWVALHQRKMQAHKHHSE